MAGAFTIEAGVPLPDPAWARNGGRPRTYPFADLAVGDSFFVPDADENKRASIRASATQHGKALGRKFTTRKQDGGIRVWRLA